ncbi:MAG: ABC transporter ATP-binding protein [Treponema sp.]|jgi:putative ABC transport system ATP-binding protein|nr:ABC transporter ATP-binding protein [Treponema sp.]
MAVIEIKGLKRLYELDGITVKALKGVDFSAEQGEFIAVMGPSGSGKSTLMNILGCLDKPSEGSYTLDSIETSTSDTDTFAFIRNQKIGFVFQAFNLLSRTSAIENVELPLLYSKARIKDARDRAETALREVGLGSRLHHLPSQLSGGQQQRVAIARAMVNDPAFILADEPTGNLDTEMTLEIMALFQQLNNHGKTIVMVTHEPELAVYMKRIITLRDGEIVSDTKVTERRSAADDLAKWKREHEELSTFAVANIASTTSATTSSEVAPAWTSLVDQDAERDSRTVALNAIEEAS